MAEKKQPTEYVILRLRDESAGPGVWAESGQSHGSSARAALHALASELGAGTYIAVPARSWQPLTVEVETRVRIS
jgi:hypothetical protein